MLFADLISEISGLTFLVLGSMAFILALVFRREIKGLLGRLTDFQWRDARVRAEPPSADDSSDSSPTSEGEESPESSPRDTEDSTKIAAAAEPDISPDSEDTIRTLMFRSYLAHDREEGDKRYNQLTSAVKDPVELKRDQARRLMSMFSGGLKDESAIASLEDMTDDPEIKSFANRMVGMCLSNSNRFEEAALAFQKSAASAAKDSERALAIALRAEALSKLDRASVARAELEALVQEVRDTGSKITAWAELAVIYEKLGQTALRPIALQKAAELAGNDAGRWFTAGYAWSNSDVEGASALTIHCYERSLKFDPKRDAALNNLGVETARLNLPIRAVEYYDAAFELDNTLAAGNTAERYLNAGFVDDAQTVIDKALSSDSPDDKVTRVAAEIGERRKTELEKQEEIAARGQDVASFLSSYGSSRLLTLPDAFLSGTWKMTDATDLNVSLSGGDLEIAWNTIGTHGHRRFRGAIAGRSAAGRFEKESTWPFADDSIHWESDGSGYITIDVDANALRLLRLQSDDSTTFRIDRSD